MSDIRMFYDTWLLLATKALTNSISTTHGRSICINSPNMDVEEHPVNITDRSMYLLQVRWLLYAVSSSNLRLLLLKIRDMNICGLQGAWFVDIKCSKLPQNFQDIIFFNFSNLLQLVNNKLCCTETHDSKTSVNASTLFQNKISMSRSCARDRILHIHCPRLMSVS